MTIHSLPNRQHRIRFMRENHTRLPRQDYAMDFYEIGDALGCSHQAAEQAYMSGLYKIMVIMADYMEFEWE